MINKLSNYEQYKGEAEAGKLGDLPISVTCLYGGFPHMGVVAQTFLSVPLRRQGYLRYRVLFWGICVSNKWPVRPIYTHAPDRVS